MSAGKAIEVVVARKVTEAQDICSFELVESRGKPLSQFSAGSHIDVQLPNGLTRQYSLCNDPAESHRYLIGVLKDPASRGGSRSLHDDVHAGDKLIISEPKNHFLLAHDARRSLLIAGGIGVTPILCMAERLAVTGAEFAMHYCTRSPSRTAFMERIAKSSFAHRVQFHHDDAGVSQKLDLDELLNSSSDAHLYVCGPKGFIEKVLDTARARAWPEAQLHYEFFAGNSIGLESDSSFEVKLASSGKVVHVGKNDTVLEALRGAGIDMSSSCEQGVCGVCLTRVLSGQPDHRDLYLTLEEKAANDQFLPCCSRSRSAQLVLDL